MEKSQLKMLKTHGNHVLKGDFPLQTWITEGDVYLSTPIGMISNWLLLLRGLKPPARTWASNRNSTHDITPEWPYPSYPIRNSCFQRCSNQLFYLHVEFQACISIVIYRQWLEPLPPISWEGEPESAESRLLWFMGLTWFDMVRAAKVSDLMFINPWFMGWLISSWSPAFVWKLIGGLKHNQVVSWMFPLGASCYKIVAGASPPSTLDECPLNIWLSHVKPFLIFFSFWWCETIPN